MNDNFPTKATKTQCTAWDDRCYQSVLVCVSAAGEGKRREGLVTIKAGVWSSYNNRSSSSCNCTTTRSCNNKAHILHQLNNNNKDNNRHGQQGIIIFWTLHLCNLTNRREVSSYSFQVTLTISVSGVSGITSHSWYPCQSQLLTLSSEQNFHEHKRTNNKYIL